MKPAIFTSLTALILMTSLAQAAEVISFAEPINSNAHIRTLAASCAACHGSNGNALHGGAVLAGLNPTYFTTQILAFKDGSRPATVMHHHAKGLNIEEIRLLADYFSKQKRVPSQTPPTQILKANHE